MFIYPHTLYLSATHMAHDTEQSQTVKAILGLRGMILKGVLQPGSRVREQFLVDELGVSRTPARAAIVHVCKQGLIDAQPLGGYTVTRFSEDDVFDAIQLRGTLEGLSARRAAERGVSAKLLQEMRTCLDELDVIVEALHDDFDPTNYDQCNERFHELLRRTAESPMIERSIDHVIELPFAASGAFVNILGTQKKIARDILLVSQDQHRGIVDAIERREGSRAEALTIEHSRSSWKYLQLTLNSDKSILQLIGEVMANADNTKADTE